jgi:hypothetical protein
MDMMKEHLSTDAGKEVTEKIGLVYQINIAPKKLGFEEVTYIVDLKKLSFSLFVDFVFLKLQIKAFFPALEHTLTNNLTQLFFLLLTPH